jgi:nitroimidazol reductase NimA-like FMN-containing flavoprotein (pyridoxamine 5'-phosphate oxidase superfamily)
VNTALSAAVINLDIEAKKSRFTHIMSSSTLSRMSYAERAVNQKPHRAVTDQDEIYAILDEGLVAHIGFLDPNTNEPVVVPVAYGRDGNRIIFHGSTGSRLFMAMRSGARICATVTLLDGIVSARSPFNSSMNYRSVMAFGIPKALDGEAKDQALIAVSERLIPGLWQAGREMTKKEFAQTMVVELELSDVTCKQRTGGALDLEDAGLPIWAGQIPIKTVFGEPVTDESAKHIEVPEYIRELTK